MIGAKIRYLDEEQENGDRCIYKPLSKGEYIIDTNSQPLVLRARPSTDSEQMALMEKGTTFVAYGFEDDSDRWLLGETSIDGTVYTGWAYKEYLTKYKDC